MRPSAAAGGHVAVGRRSRSARLAVDVMRARTMRSCSPGPAGKLAKPGGIVELERQHARHRPADLGLRGGRRGREQQQAAPPGRSEPHRRPFLTRTTRIGMRTRTTSPPAARTRKMTTRERAVGEAGDDVAGLAQRDRGLGDRPAAQAVADLDLGAARRRRAAPVDPAGQAAGVAVGAAGGEHGHAAAVAQRPRASLIDSCGDAQLEADSPADAAAPGDGCGVTCPEPIWTVTSHGCRRARCTVRGAACSRP